MKVQLQSGKQANVYFYYSADIGCSELKHGSKNLGWKGRKFTTCSIEISEQEEKVVKVGRSGKIHTSFAGYMTRGRAICGPKDVFAKSVGRRLAIGRALRAANPMMLTESDKKTIWDEYYKCHSDEKKHVDIETAIGNDDVSIIDIRTKIEKSEKKRHITEKAAK